MAVNHARFRFARGAIVGRSLAKWSFMSGSRAWAVLSILGFAAIAACSSGGGLAIDEGDPGAAGANGSSPGAGGGGDNSNGNSGDSVDGGDGGLDLDTVADPLFFLPQGAAQMTALCARNLGDAVAK